MHSILAIWLIFSLCSPLLARQPTRRPSSPPALRASALSQVPSQHDELDLVGSLQKGYVNFYAPGALMPYIPLAAKGPWIVTTHGAVVHDSGGYGMLGFGHNDDRISGMCEQCERDHELQS
jgi:hypothetical protein